MASKLLFLNFLMDRRNKPNKDGTDELAFVKAAAWAWYQHGSGSEGKAMSEFDVTRTQRTPRPSRYKLEAMRMANDEAKDQGSSSSPIHNKNSLLDAYEVQSISRQLDNLLESNNNNHHNNKLVNGTDNTSSATSLDSGRRMVKKKSGKGFWLRHAAVCGRGEDVVDPSSAFRDGGHQQSAKRVPVVHSVK